MVRRKAPGVGQTRFQLEPSPTAVCVPAIRSAVEKWRSGGYDGTSATTRILLNHWFRRDHISEEGAPFNYHRAQRESVETLIYLFEVVKVRRLKNLVEEYARESNALRLLQYDDFARYCIKMATGSGKTKVMALAIAWQYFNAISERNPDFSASSLLIAPNVIVYERLRTDFELGRIFRSDPVVPPELESDWDFECYVRGDGERGFTKGALYLTNIQQLYERPPGAIAEPPPIAKVLGRKPADIIRDIQSVESRLRRRRGPLLLLNDEAHHTHDEDQKWNEVLRKLHTNLRGGVGCELDFSATPRFPEGGLFTWTVFDYPLKQAIADGVVKRPVKGVTKGISEGRSNIASRKYAAYLAAGVERWKEYRSKLAKLGKKPVLFVMLSNTAEADDVGDYLRTRYPAEFGGGRLQVIHTDRTGEVTDADLELARGMVRTVDSVSNPVNAIVSVLMLREGWDVQNVTVVVGLRPYTSKANILPEQTIGRGLRLMFRGITSPDTFVERVDVIGNQAFIQFVDELDQEEDLALETFRLGVDRLEIVTILPMTERSEYDIELPTLSPALVRKKTLAEEIESLDVSLFECPPLPLRPNETEAKTFRYLGYDLLTLEKLVDRRYYIPEPQTAQEVISFYSKRIAEELKLPSQFANLVPKVREFLRLKAFGKEVDLESPEALRAISTNPVQYVTTDQFAKSLRRVITEPREPTLVSDPRRLSEAEPFPFSKETLRARKTVFNLVACANPFEKDFAKFLDRAEDVVAFAKLPERFGFSIEYTDSVANLRHYFPDWIVKTSDGSNHIVETKGREDIDVQHKDRAAMLWCANATRLTGHRWLYRKVTQGEWSKLRPERFEDLQVLPR